MGRKDIITKEYMGDTEVFADVFNHIIYQGRKVINPKNLNADKHSPASSVRSTKRRVRGMLMSVEAEGSH